MQTLPKHFKIKKNVSLKKYNTFGLDVKAKAFLSIYSTLQLQKLLAHYNGEIFILGGGSNLLLTQDMEQLVLHNQIKGKELCRRFRKCVYLRAGGGENWHRFVLWTIQQGFGGLENLSLIPGSVGAAPIQNIGAYGVELKDVFHSLKAVHLATGKIHTFRKKDCLFDYRNSIFKQKLKGEYFITEVTFKLSTIPKVNISYGTIRQVLAARNIKNPSIKEVSNAIIYIRTQKLPDPAKLGNAGSFFKNPIVSQRKLKQLQKSHPDIPFYPLSDKEVKLPAAWLIEQCGWKGKKIGQTGCHQNQALVIVNYGNAKGKDIWKHAQRVMDSVKKQFGILLSPEVNVLPFIK